MKKNNIIENILNAYLKKQRNFKKLIKNIQCSILSKEYKQYDCSFEEYIKKNGKFQKAYRYLISAKVIDQLDDFEIQPCYERICRSIYSCAKTSSQMKLLWGSILQNAGNRPDCINSSHVTKMWKKLCSDKRYYKICHYEDEIITNIEKSLNKNSKELKHKRSNNKTSKNNNISQMKPINNNPTSFNTIISNNEYQFVPLNNSNDSYSINSQYTIYPSPIVQYNNGSSDSSNGYSNYYSNNQNFTSQNQDKYIIATVNNTNNSHFSNSPVLNVSSTSQNQNKYKMVTFNDINNSQTSYNSPILNISSTSQNNKTNYCFPSPQVHDDQILNFNQTNIKNVKISSINTVNKINTMEYPVINNQSNIKNTNTIVVPSLSPMNYSNTEIQPHQQSIEYHYSQALPTHQNLQSQTKSQAQSQQPQQIIFYY